MTNRIAAAACLLALFSAQPAAATPQAPGRFHAGQVQRQRRVSDREPRLEKLFLSAAAGERILGVATYTNIRQFKVATSESIKH